MKKTLAFILTIVMVMGLFAGCNKEEAPETTGSAAATETVAVEETTTSMVEATTSWDEVDLGSPSASEEYLTPILTPDSEEIVELYSTEAVAELSEEIYNVMAEAKQNLEAACPEGEVVQYFFYLDIVIDESPVTVAFEPIDHLGITFMQYVDGQWVEMEYTMDENGILTVPNVVEAPIAVLV